MSQPPDRVLDLFAVPGDVTAIPGGQGSSVRAGDLVLSPGRDAVTQDWLSPLLARLAVRLDEAPGRRARDLRLAMPVPARDGHWVVDGWAASRYEPGTTACTDLDVTLAAGRVLHARLASLVPTRPEALDRRTDRWARAERAAYAEDPARGTDGALADLLTRVRRGLDDVDPDPRPDQLVHADLAGNVLLDPAGAPVVIDVSPAWRPVTWAEAVCVLDAVMWLDAPRAALDRFAAGPDRAAMLRALAFRLRADEPTDLTAYERVLDRLYRAQSSVTGSR